MFRQLRNHTTLILISIALAWLVLLTFYTVWMETKVTGFDPKSVSGLVEVSSSSPTSVFILVNRQTVIADLDEGIKLYLFSARRGDSIDIHAHGYPSITLTLQIDQKTIRTETGQDISYRYDVPLTG